VTLSGGHFDAYVKDFDSASKPRVTRFVDCLTSSAGLQSEEGFEWILLRKSRVEADRQHTNRWSTARKRTSRAGLSRAR
jgi:hypothetical protein